ncbi:MAG: SRPBCC domain-containing protein [Bacteroidales bacterium]|jgi:uncharacterized protein YndB with AHSA1/START domain|nr:SRPBCC domain-containing protein [Bacteroidales bacterium]
MSPDTEPIIVEQTFNTSVNNVWDAITNVDQMTQWFFENIESFKPEVGFETNFNVQSVSRSFMHLWKITEVVPFKKIVYSWRYEGISGEAIVWFELIELGKQTKLRLTNIGLESFPKHIPEFTKENCIGGWNYFIKDRLKIFLNKKLK